MSALIGRRTAAHLLTRETLQVMLEQPVSPNGLRGVILNMASVAATVPETRHFNTFRLRSQQRSGDHDDESSGGLLRPARYPR